MSSSEINTIQENICTELCVHICELGFALDGYLSSFEREDFFSFRDSEARDKLYKQSYYRFMSDAAQILERIEPAVARLAELLVAADEAVELEMIAMIGAKLESFRAFEESLSSFSESTQKAISKGNVSPSLLVGEARRLKIIIEELDKRLKDA